MNKFKVGDKVRCIKTDGNTQLTKGRISTVTNLDNEFVYIDDTVGGWKLNKFELVQEKTNYKITKPFTLSDIFEKTPCHDEFAELLKERQGWTGDAPFEIWSDIEESTILMRNLPWLESNGFIEKENIFEPFTLRLKICTKQELVELHYRLNWVEKESPQAISNVYPLWTQVDQQLCRIEKE